MEFNTAGNAFDRQIADRPGTYYNVKADMPRSKIDADAINANGIVEILKQVGGIMTNDMWKAAKNIHTDLRYRMMHDFSAGERQIGDGPVKITIEGIKGSPRQSKLQR